MIVVDKRIKEVTKLGDLRKGDTFMFVDTSDKLLRDAVKIPLEQSVFMVTTVNPFCDIRNAIVSVVCLNNGTSFNHDGNEEIIPVTVELTIVK